MFLASPNNEPKNQKHQKVLHCRTINSFFESLHPLDMELSDANDVTLPLLVPDDLDSDILLFFVVVRFDDLSKRTLPQYINHFEPITDMVVHHTHVTTALVVVT